MSKGKAPADQFYWGDWLRDAELQMACSATRGIWANALARMWFAKTKGELVGTEVKLAPFLNATNEEFVVFLEEAEALGFCYVSRNSNGNITIRNRRMYRKGKEQESNRLRQQRYYEKHKPNGDLTTPSSSPSLLSSKNPPYSPPKGTGKSLSKKMPQNHFDYFWQAYPKKQAKKDAQKAFLKLNPSPELLTIIKSKLETAKQSEAWKKDKGQYIPLPATWLRGERWEDEIVIPTETTTDISRNPTCEKCQQKEARYQYGDDGPWLCKECWPEIETNVEIVKQATDGIGKKMPKQKMTEPEQEKRIALLRKQAELLKKKEDMAE